MYMWKIENRTLNAKFSNVTIRYTAIKCGNDEWVGKGGALKALWNAFVKQILPAQILWHQKWQFFFLKKIINRVPLVFLWLNNLKCKVSSCLTFLTVVCKWTVTIWNYLHEFPISKCNIITSIFTILFSKIFAFLNHIDNPPASNLFKALDIAPIKWQSQYLWLGVWVSVSHRIPQHFGGDDDLMASAISVRVKCS